jgi:hypothetical protein
MWARLDAQGAIVPESETGTTFLTREWSCDMVRVHVLEKLVKNFRAVAAVLTLMVSPGGPAWAQSTDTPPADAPETTAPPAETPDSAGTEEETPETAGTEDAAAEERSSEFNRELLTIEEKVNTLKERVFRSKATLQLLKEIVVQGSSAGSRGSIYHINKLGRGYTIESIAYYMDGQGKYSKVDPSGALDKQREIKIFDGPIPPGNHNLTVHLKLKGNGFGIFSYVKDYVFNVQATTAFVAEDGKSCRVEAVINERSGIGRSFTERPYVKFETRCIRLAEDSPEGR